MVQLVLCPVVGQNARTLSRDNRLLGIDDDDTGVFTCLLGGNQLLSDSASQSTEDFVLCIVNECFRLSQGCTPPCLLDSFSSNHGY